MHTKTSAFLFSVSVLLMPVLASAAPPQEAGPKTYAKIRSPRPGQRVKVFDGDRVVPARVLGRGAKWGAKRGQPVVQLESGRRLPIPFYMPVLTKRTPRMETASPADLKWGKRVFTIGHQGLIESLWISSTTMAPNTFHSVVQGELPATPLKVYVPVAK